jgi:hypothetical protein
LLQEPERGKEGGIAEEEERGAASINEIAKRRSVELLLHGIVKEEMLKCWCVGVLECWSVGVFLVCACWRVG